MYMKQVHLIQWNKSRNCLKSGEQQNKIICVAENIENQDFEFEEQGDTFHRNERTDARKVTLFSHIANFCEPDQGIET